MLQEFQLCLDNDGEPLKWFKQGLEMTRSQDGLALRKMTVDVV